MYDRETVELALYAPEEGMTQREAAELCGVSRASVGFWAAGRVPHERGAGRIRVDGRTGARDAGVPAVNAEERAAYEAAMTENTLLKAVLDDLKAEGCAPATTSRRRCVELGGEIARGDRPAPDPHTRVPWDLEEPLRVPPGEAGGR